MTRTNKKICFITATRADYGLLYWTMKQLDNDPDLDLFLCVTGTHLSDNYGNTVNQITKDGFTVNSRIDIQINSTSPDDILNSMRIAMGDFSKVLLKEKPDAIFILGDRYEMLAFATASTIYSIPIIHAHGGEITEGANDDKIRHAITKLSALHFTSTDTYKNRVVQMGASPEFVHNVGAFGFENVNKLNLISRDTLEAQLDFKLGKASAIVTFHPETMESEQTLNHLDNLISALKESSLNLIFTYPNADLLGEQMIERINKFGAENPDRVKVVKSLGQINYLSALRQVDMVIGNSSSGIIEVPSFKIPTVNIGNRQRGRIASKTVINCGTSKMEIQNAIKKANSQEFKAICGTAFNPYEQPNTSRKVLEILKTTNFNEANQCSFFDIN